MKKALRGILLFFLLIFAALALVFFKLGLGKFLKLSSKPNYPFLARLNSKNSRPSLINNAWADVPPPEAASNCSTGGSCSCTCDSGGDCGCSD